MKSNVSLCTAVLITLALATALLVNPSRGVTPEQKRTHAKAARDPLANLTARDLASGKKLFVGHCAYCHGINGAGERGPNLARPVLKRAPDNLALFKLIQNGIDGSEMPAAWQLSDREVRQVAGYVRSLGRTNPVPIPGDIQRGRALYDSKGECASCHIVRGRGGILGPELTDVGLRRSPAYLREALTNPGASVPEGFLMVRVETRDGVKAEGIRLNEDSFTIQLRDLSGRFRSFGKPDLTAMEKEFGKSPMPSYSKTFSAAEMCDLIAYLASLRGEN